MAYRIEYAPDIESHLRTLNTRQRVIVLDAVDRQLAHQPRVATKNRKPMRPNPLAPWELRIGELRVYYDVVEQPDRLVRVLAVRIKRRDQVRIGKEIVKL